MLENKKTHKKCRRAEAKERPERERSFFFIVQDMSKFEELIQDQFFDDSQWDHSYFHPKVLTISFANPKTLKTVQDALDKLQVSGVKLERPGLGKTLFEQMMDENETKEEKKEDKEEEKKKEKKVEKTPSYMERKIKTISEENVSLMGDFAQGEKKLPKIEKEKTIEIKKKKISQKSFLEIPEVDSEGDQIKEAQQKMKMNEEKKNGKEIYESLEDLLNRSAKKLPKIMLEKIEFKKQEEARRRQELEDRAKEMQGNVLFLNLPLGLDTNATP